MRFPLVATALSCLVLNGCPYNEVYVTKTMWQYQTGHRFVSSDFIKFYEPSWDLSGDTIFHMDKPIGIVTSASEYWETMTVESLDGNDEGVYLDATSFLK